MDTTNKATLINPTTCFAAACFAFSLLALTSVWRGAPQASTDGTHRIGEDRLQLRPKAVRRRGVDSLYIGRPDENVFNTDDDSQKIVNSTDTLKELIDLASSVCLTLQNVGLPGSLGTITASLQHELSTLLTNLCRLHQMLLNKSSLATNGGPIVKIYCSNLQRVLLALQKDLSSRDVEYDAIKAALQELRDQRPALEFMLERSGASELPPTPPCEPESPITSAPPTGLTPGVIDVKGWIEPPPEYTPPSEGSAAYLAVPNPDSKSVVISPPEQHDNSTDAGASDDLLFHAVTENDFKLLKQLLSKGVNANRSYGDIQRTAMHQAAHLNHCACLSLLLSDSAATLTTEDAGGDMAIHLAAWAGHVEALSVLLAHGADVDWLSGRDGYSPLWCAVSAHHIDAARLLLKYGARLGMRSSSGGLHPLHQAAVTGQSAMCELLLERGAQVDALDDENCSALHYAAVSGSLPTVKVLLKEGAQVALQQAQGLSPLHWAAHKGYKEVVSILLAHEAPINATTEGGATPLHMTANRGHSKVTLLLLEKGAKRSMSGEWDGVGGKPVEMAEAKGHSKVASLIRSFKQ